MCSRVGSTAMPANVVQKIQGKYKNASSKTQAQNTEIAEAQKHIVTTGPKNNLMFTYGS
jgi:hypothetical protein